MPGGRKTNLHTLRCTHSSWVITSTPMVWTTAAMLIPKRSLISGPSPTPYLRLTEEYLSLMSAGAFKPRHPTLNSSVSCLNLFLCPDSPSLFMAPSSDPLNPWVRPWARPSSPCLSPGCSPCPVILLLNHLADLWLALPPHGNGPKVRSSPFVTGLLPSLPPCSPALSSWALGIHSPLGFPKRKSKQSPPFKAFWWKANCL